MKGLPEALLKEITSLKESLQRSETPDSLQMRLKRGRKKLTTSVRLKRGRKKRLRSRVAYIDEALLEQEDGTDAYCDLEDFIVD